MTITVDANLFRLVYGAVSTEETRYYLNGVHIEPHPEKGAILVATDGHRMIVAHDDKAECDESAIVQLSRHALTHCKAKKNERKTIAVDVAGKKATIDGGFVADDAIVDGTFPDWRRVVPREATKPTKSNAPIFNPQYLHDFGKVGMEIEKTIGGTGSMHIALSDGASAVVIRWAGVHHIFALLMPIRADVPGFLPAFMTTPKQFKEAAE